MERNTNGGKREAGYFFFRFFVLSLKGPLTASSTASLASEQRWDSSSEETLEAGLYSNRCSFSLTP
jgi:hypothetical protein